VSADRQRFLFAKSTSDVSAEAVSASLVVVQHWTEELKRLVPTR
jgi:hypothetical protein